MGFIKFFECYLCFYQELKSLMFSYHEECIFWALRVLKIM